MTDISRNKDEHPAPHDPPHVVITDRIIMGHGNALRGLIKEAFNRKDEAGVRMIMIEMETIQNVINERTRELYTPPGAKVSVTIADGNHVDGVVVAIADGMVWVKTNAVKAHIVVKEKTVELML